MIAPGRPGSFAPRAGRPSTGAGRRVGLALAASLALHGALLALILLLLPPTNEPQAPGALSVTIMQLPSGPTGQADAVPAPSLAASAAPQAASAAGSAPAAPPPLPAKSMPAAPTPPVVSPAAQAVSTTMPAAPDIAPSLPSLITASPQASSPTPPPVSTMPPVPLEVRQAAETPARPPAAPPRTANARAARSVAKSAEPRERQPGEGAASRAQPPAGVPGNAPAASSPAPSAAPATRGGPATAGYVNMVRAAIAAHRAYPPQAALRHIEGTITLRLTIAADGRLIDVEVMNGGPELLASAALKSVRAAAPFQPLPAGSGGQQTIETQLVYRLE